MIYALDTNIISYLLRPSHNRGLIQKFVAETQNNSYVIPPLCYYETLWYLKRKKAVSQLSVFNNICNNSMGNITMNKADYIKAADIRVYLEERGTPIGVNDADIFIAAFCLVNNYTLVTNNTKHFKCIEGLQIVDWKE